jgi:hypothetical protein
MNNFTDSNHPSFFSWQNHNPFKNLPNSKIDMNLSNLLLLGSSATKNDEGLATILEGNKENCHARVSEIALKSSSKSLLQKRSYIMT